MFARLGGDEFIVLFTDTSIERAEEIIARLRQSMDRYNSETSCEYDISFKAGIMAVDPEQDDSIDALLSRADHLMYENKQERL